MTPQVHCARQLLYRGIDKTIRNKAGQTAYEVAALTSNFVIMDDITNFKPEHAGLNFYKISAGIMNEGLATTSHFILPSHSGI
jgi:ankyrin repeat protein